MVTISMSAETEIYNVYKHVDVQKKALHELTQFSLW